MTDSQNKLNLTGILEDLVHTDVSWPAWMDTVGLDEGDAEDVNGELVQQTLIFVVLSCSELLTSTGSR